MHDHDGAKRPRKYERLVVPALASGCVLLGAINLWMWLVPGARSSGTAGATSSPQPNQQETGADAVGGMEAAGGTKAVGGMEVGGETRAGGGRRAGGAVEADGAESGGTLQATDGARSILPAAPPQPDLVPEARGTSPSGSASPEAPRASSPADLARPGASLQEKSHGPATPGPSDAAAGSPQERRATDDAPPADADASDHTPPVLGQVRFEPGVVEGGSATTLTIQASDALSGVKSVRGEIQSPSGAAVLPLYLQDAHGGNSFTYVMNIPASAETGIWFVKWLYLTDVADNSALIQVASASEALPGGTFSVSSSESDSIPPDVIEVSFDKDRIENEGRNVIRVEVRDDLSGVTSVMGVCQSPSGSALVPFRCALNEESGLWEGDVMIPGNADCGVWSVQQLSAKDKAGNTARLAADSRVLADASFTVAPSADCDSSPPTLDSFVLSQTTVSGDVANEIVITAAVHDVGSGPATLDGWFEGPVSEGGQVPKNHFSCAADPDRPEAPWTGRIVVPQLAPKGIWKIREIALKDKALNVRTYTPADPVMSGGVFEVR